ncbi:MAG TPA: (d)CMP kinase [Nitrospiria bacterium]|nr:(d)CMP kinase [Nitrospiria bacterium]
MKRKIAIAIDGPSASGKTTVARLLAAELGFDWLDTGLLYRAMAWTVLQEKIDPLDEAAVSRISGEKGVTLRRVEGSFAVEIDGKDVTRELKTPELSRIASQISQYRAVRESLAGIQRETGNEGNVILVGRDIGTQILPDAPVKFFLDASLETRGKRRQEELVRKGFRVTLAETIREMSQRDRQDRERAIAPMEKAPDAILIDSTGMSLKEVIMNMREKVGKVTA